MANEVFSRYYRALQYTDETTRTGDSRTLLAFRFPFPYIEHPGNKTYTVAEGDSLATVAYKTYGELGSSFEGFSTARLYWAIADFQPIPILDPFIQLQVGRKLVLPATELLRNQIVGG